MMSPVSLLSSPISVAYSDDYPPPSFIIKPNSYLERSVGRNVTEIAFEDAEKLSALRAVKELAYEDAEKHSALRAVRELAYEDVEKLSALRAVRELAYEDVEKLSKLRAVRKLAYEDVEKLSALRTVRELAYDDVEKKLELSEKQNKLNWAHEYLLDELDKGKRGDGNCDRAKILITAAYDNYQERLREFEQCATGYIETEPGDSPTRPGDSISGPGDSLSGSVDSLTGPGPPTRPLDSLTGRAWRKPNVRVDSHLSPSAVDIPDLLLANPRYRAQPPDGTHFTSPTSPGSVYKQQLEVNERKRRHDDLTRWACAQRFMSPGDDSHVTGDVKLYHNELYPDSMDRYRGVSAGSGGGAPSVTAAARSTDMVTAELRKVLEIRHARSAASVTDSYVPQVSASTTDS